MTNVTSMETYRVAGRVYSFYLWMVQVVHRVQRWYFNTSVFGVTFCRHVVCGGDVWAL